MERTYQRSEYFTTGFPFAASHVRNSAEEFNLNQRFRREFWKIVYVENGRGRFVQGERAYPIGPKSVYLVHPEASTTLDIDGEEIELVNLMFDASVIREFLPDALDPFHFFDIFCPGFRPDDDARMYQTRANRRIVSLVHGLEQEYGRRPPNWRLAVRLELMDLLLHLRRATEHRFRAHAGEMVEYVRWQMVPATDGGFSPRRMAAELGVTPGHLSRLFRKETGRSITEEWNAVRIERAESLLGDTDAPVQDIAARAGFGDLSTFFKKFRAATGQSPRKFRETIRKR